MGRIFETRKATNGTQHLFSYLKNNGIVYHSASFEKETEVSGFFELNAYIETDVKDVDIKEDIYEIKADGTSIFLTSNASGLSLVKQPSKNILLNVWGRKGACIWSGCIIRTDFDKKPAQ